MSAHRARCPFCGTVTAVAIDGGYECHVCGRSFPAALVRVPRAWGDGGAAMADAAFLPLPYPEAAVVAEDALGAQTLAVASELPARPIVLGGCCCAHIGAIDALASRHARLAVVWLDAHGDLNTPATSPSGNVWGMPLRIAIDSGAIAAEDVALVGARSLDPPEEEFISAAGVHRDDVGAALDACDAVYVALDCDVLEPREIAAFMPEPGGPGVEEVANLLARVRAEKPVAGIGLTGLRAEPRNVEPLATLVAAAL